MGIERLTKLCEGDNMYFQYELIDEIIKLIDTATEGEYWDFKRQWYGEEGKADLLHDIICMSNNLVDRDSYIIIGVEDDGKVCGIDKDPNRMSQQNIIDFLRSKKFAGNIRPTVYVIKSLPIREKIIDVIVIKDTTNTPYFLTEPYRKVGVNIYTRIGDTNTPKNKMADYDKILRLWRKFEGIDKSPLERFNIYLKNLKDWLPSAADGIHSDSKGACTWYYRQYPEFTISYDLCEDRFQHGKVDVMEGDIYWLDKLPKSPNGSLHNVYIYELSLMYHSTCLNRTLAIFADSMRFCRILWKQEYFCFSDGKGLPCSYIEKDSLDFLLDSWLCNHRETIPETNDMTIINPLEPWRICSDYRNKNPYDSVLVFENEEEHKQFTEYVKNAKNLDAFWHYNGEVYRGYVPYLKHLCICGEKLVQLLNEWRNEPAKGIM